MYRLPHDTAETDGLKQGGGIRIQPCHYLRVTIPWDLWFFLPSLQSKPCALIGWQMQVILIGLQHAAFGTGWNWCSEPFQPYSHDDIRSVWDQIQTVLLYHIMSRTVHVSVPSGKTSVVWYPCLRYQACYVIKSPCLGQNLYVWC